jgi:hypothetical protein
MEREGHMIRVGGGRVPREGVLAEGVGWWEGAFAKESGGICKRIISASLCRNKLLFKGFDVDI